MAGGATLLAHVAIPGSKNQFVIYDSTAAALDPRVRLFVVAALIVSVTAAMHRLSIQLYLQGLLDHAKVVEHCMALKAKAKRLFEQSLVPNRVEPVKSKELAVSGGALSVKALLDRFQLIQNTYAGSNYFVMLCSMVCSSLIESAVSLITSFSAYASQAVESLQRVTGRLFTSVAQHVRDMDSTGMLIGAATAAIVADAASEEIDLISLISDYAGSIAIMSAGTVTATKLLPALYKHMSGKYSKKLATVAASAGYAGLLALVSGLMDNSAEDQYEVTDYLSYYSTAISVTLAALGATLGVAEKRASAEMQTMLPVALT